MTYNEDQQHSAKKDFFCINKLVQHMKKGQKEKWSCKGNNGRSILITWLDTFLDEFKYLFKASNCPRNNIRKYLKNCVIHRQKLHYQTHKEQIGKNRRYIYRWKNKPSMWQLMYVVESFKKPLCSKWRLRALSSSYLRFHSAASACAEAFPSAARLRAFATARES